MSCYTASSSHHGLWVVLASLAFMFAVNGEQCVQGGNCKLPDCFCPTFTHPLGRENIPQIVYFGFDDAVTPLVSPFYDTLFNENRKNPNGCPVTMTLYISDQYTKYDLVNKYYKRGHEMGVHSVTHSNIDTDQKLMTEADQQRKNIATKGQVPLEEIVGWRSPNLKSAGDGQPRILKDLKYTYDNSLVYSKDRDYPFPFTLDYGFPHGCSIQPCPSPTSKRPGFWELMIHTLYDPKTGRPCGYVDGCRPTTKDDAVDYLWHNFLMTYENERAPFGLNMHASWFLFTQPPYLTAMEEFLDRLSTLDDVYIVSVKQMLEWMKNPTKLSDINSFQPWGCTGMPATTTTSKPETEIMQVVSSTTMPPPPPPTTTVAQSQGQNQDTASSSSSSCEQGSNCKLPNCYCKTNLPPRTPQIVYLTIESRVDGRTFDALTSVFSGIIQTPNRCPVTGSLFIPPTGNNPTYAQMLSRLGARLGLALVDNPQNEALKTLRQQLSANHGVLNKRPAKVSNEVARFLLEPVSSDSFVLEEYPEMDWPYTVDYETNEENCPLSSSCQSETNSGLWLVPQLDTSRYSSGSCSGGQPCPWRPDNAADTHRALKEDFDSTYNGQRKPFGVHIDEEWLVGPNGSNRIQGLKSFFNDILRNQDVMIVSVDKMLKWISSSGLSGRLPC